mmetsp:Transcript_6290/g.14465  ORF Transcript_6290/g.14465 Transcript_6290/m.14465 type:complete len:288 (+) Transcript_6290:72-935(+)
MATRIYIGNLPMDIRERELDDLFYRFGRITDIQVKRPARPPAFAFISYSDPRDAADAVHYRDGYDFDGGRIRVEVMRGGGGFGGGFGGPPTDVTRGSGTSQYRVIVDGLPKSASWQDLKDHFKKHCEVTRTDVDRQGRGCVEFRNERDMEDGLKLDKSLFMNPFSECKIRVMLPSEFKEGRGGGRSRSRSRSGGRGRSRSRSRDRSRSRERKSRRSDSRSERSRSRSDSRDRKRRSRSDSRDKEEEEDKKVEDDKAMEDDKASDKANGDKAEEEVPKEETAVAADDE